MKREIIVLLSLLLLPLSFAATPYNPNVGSHSLQQLTTDQTGSTSVDANSDGVIDRAEAVGTLDGDASLGDGTTTAVLKIKGATTLWSAIDFYSGSASAIWGMGRNQNDDNFYIDRTGVQRALTIDKTTLNVGIGTTAPTQKLDVNGQVKANGYCIGASCISSWPSGAPANCNSPFGYHGEISILSYGYCNSALSITQCVNGVWRTYSTSPPDCSSGY